MFDYGLSQAQVLNQVQQPLAALRAALAACQDLYGWSSTIAAGDLVGLGFSQADAQSILNACADANSLAMAYNGEEITPALPYNFSASQRIVIGP